MVVVIALASALVGPLLSAPQGKKAGAPFVYEPPEGFTRREANDAIVWTLDERGAATKSVQTTSAVVTHSAKTMSVEEADLASLTQEMATVFADCRWVHRRHELRTRADGARVGVIEGDCDKEVDLAALGLPAKTIKTRKLQLMFPDDSGTSIVTVSYPTDQATRWEPLFEATIAKASGVATRVPPPPSWMYAAWAVAGLVIAWLVTALVAKPSPQKPEPAA